MSKNNEDTSKRIMQDMINTFSPATERERHLPNTIMLTTDELAERMIPMMQVNKEELSKELFNAGFRFIYEGDTWKWMLKYRD